MVDVYHIDVRREVYSLAFETPFIGQAIVSPEGQFIRCNKTFCEMVGYSENELRQKLWKQITHPDDIGDSLQYVEDLHANKPRPEGLLKRYQHRRGNFITCEVYASLIRDKNEQPRFFITHILDVTQEMADQALLEQKVRERTRDLRASNAALESFAYAASHDLREPLNKIVAFGKRLEHKYGMQLDERGMEYLSIMESAAQRMAALIDDLLMYSRAGRADATATQLDLEKEIRFVLSDLELSIEESGAEIVLDVDAPPIMAHKARIQQVFQNLISNAIKFRKPDVPPRIEVVGRQKREGVEFTVSDNGIGFEQRRATDIFVLFKRLHSRFDYPGTGIGLALCRRILESYGGSIIAKGEPNVGATFILWIPTGGQTHE